MTWKRSLSAIVLTIFMAFPVLSIGNSPVRAGPTQCSDGIDNDGDGLIDWQYDLGCYNKFDPTEGGSPSRHIEDGWSVFEPSKDTRIIYVSSSGGRDANDGRSPRTPKKTVAAGKKLLRNGFPDWLLLKRGDVWKGQGLGFWSKSGRSHTEPMVVASYGDSVERPRFEVSSDWWRAHQGGAKEIRHLSIVGLNAYFYTKDPSNPEFTGLGGSAFQWLVDGGDLLLEDNKFEYGGLSFQLNPTLGFVLRRNIFSKNYSINSHAQSLFTHIKAPFLIEENLFFHGGWNDEFRLVVTPITDLPRWAKVSDGQFDITLAGEVYSVKNVDLKGVRSMDAVAKKIETAINKQVGGDITFDWTLGGVFVLKSQHFKSSKKYGISRYTGAESGTDIYGPSYMNGASAGVPESTIFNRNMYLSAGYGKTIVRGNIDADGASGGVQLRMGGLIEDNLFLQDPIAITIGHPENPANSITSGVVRDNVVLDSRDIDTQAQGTGIWVIGRGAGYARNVEIFNNIVTRNKLGTFNVKAYGLSLKKGSGNISLHDNIAYDWHSHRGSNDDRGPLLEISVEPGVENVNIRNNDFQNPERGRLATARNGDFSGITLSGNNYYSGSPDPGESNSGWFEINGSRARSSSSAWYDKVYAKVYNKFIRTGGTVSSSEWFSESGETDYRTGLVKYPDPNRDIASYMRSLGKAPTLEAFIAGAIQQSKFSWRPEYTAHEVNEYVRDGFGKVSSQASGN